MSARLVVVASLIEVAPASALGAGPVLVALAPFLVGDGGSVSLAPSDCSEFGFSLSGSDDNLRAVAEHLRVLFGPAVLVGPLEDVFA